MPNIEIHGIGIRGAFVEDAQSLRTEIFRLFGDKIYVSEIVVTTFDNEVKDKNDHRQPFLRVVSTSSPHLDEIIELLETLGMDIELQELKAFYSKPKVG